MGTGYDPVISSIERDHQLHVYPSCRLDALVGGDTDDTAEEGDYDVALFQSSEEEVSGCYTHTVCTCDVCLFVCDRRRWRV